MKVPMPAMKQVPKSGSPAHAKEMVRKHRPQAVGNVGKTKRNLARYPK